MAENNFPTRPIRIDTECHHGVSFLKLAGALDAASYRMLRDTMIKAALDEPRAVLVDINDLSVSSPSSYSVFASARWHVSVWPDVPILLVCADPRRRQAITRSGAARYAPVHPTGEAALAMVADGSPAARRRARTQLPADAVSIGLARHSVADWLTAWGQEELTAVAGLVATIFVDNVLAHTDSAPLLIVENYQDTVTVAVQDGSRTPASLHEDSDRGAEIVSGLGIVAALCRAWGSTPTPTGKTVWASVGRENRL
ncbi:STAS domain-containing protein [Mycobacterium conspicuum]|uniref:Sulfate transporter n=1 Tax=Mycobacterium conspicuum TaxID=44010 RepID=A0A7I7Y9K5_9MYCO|nr:sulfate transporter [Mycobacterium conspicuum]